MARLVSPPSEQLDELRQSLTKGEKLVFEFFDELLPESWEIYLQPHLNGLRPDFVLLNPDVGIAVYEVKDWNLDAMERWMELDPGRAPRLMGRRDGTTFSCQQENPVEKVRQYKDEIENLYCPGLGKRAGYVVITAGVIFTNAGDEEVRALFQPARTYHGMLDHEKYFPLTGKNALRAGAIDEVFPEHARTSSQYMTSGHAEDLRRWLVEPDAPATQRRPLELDDNQKMLVTSRTDSGYRRIKGPAGTGKSLVLAARAAQLASEGKEVLVVTYNITLMNYLKDLAVRWPHPTIGARRGITWLNFHLWCKRVCQEAGREDDYYALWRDTEDENLIPDPYIGQYSGGRSDTLDGRLPDLVRSVLEEDSARQVSLYDAILVDEGQDFSPSWWRVLRMVCKQGGEMVLVADVSQDTYGRALDWPEGAWTDRSMKGAGFSGPWARLSICYRTPPALTAHARAFAERYLPNNLRDLPTPQQLELDLYPCRLRWVQTTTDCLTVVGTDEILSLCCSALGEELSISDVTFLVDKNASGRELVKALGCKGIKVVHTFAADGQASRKQKIGFYMGDARVKGTTLHSFKGWEARAIVLCIERAAGPSKLALVYSGLTRLKRHEHGSFLTVVSAATNLEQYGQTWPDFGRA